MITIPTTVKPWGYEELLEQNDKYVLKRIVMNKGHKCSLQYHEKKTETIYVISGGPLRISINNLEYDKHYQSCPITINPLEVHRMEAIEDCVYLEVSTPELEDVVRIEDDYGRITKL